MSYTLVDDGFHSNPKVIAAGLDGAGLYARALSYCGAYLTDGFVPTEWVKQATTGRRGAALKCLDAGLWKITEGGYYIPDYLEFNPSREEVVARREERSKSGKAGARKRWQTASNSDSSSHGSSHSDSHGVATNVGDGKTMARAPAAPAPTPTPKEKESPNGLMSQNTEDDPLDEAAIQAVYATWRNNFDKNHGRYNTITKARRQKIKSRLREFSVTDLQAALRNAADDTWEGRSNHDDLLVLLKSREKVERWLDYKPATNGKSGGGLSVADILAMKEAS